jgi:hypothetical protein
MSETDWQPIETAPKDGSKIMLFGRWKAYDILPGGEPCYLLVWWCSAMSDGSGHCWITDGLSSLGETLFPNLSSPATADHWNVGWTHWRPLPEPPRAATP